MFAFQKCVFLVSNLLEDLVFDLRFAEFRLWEHLQELWNWEYVSHHDQILQLYCLSIVACIFHEIIIVSTFCVAEDFHIKGVNRCLKAFWAFFTEKTRWSLLFNVLLQIAIVRLIPHGYTARHITNCLAIFMEVVITNDWVGVNGTIPRDLIRDIEQLSHELDWIEIFVDHVGDVCNLVDVLMVFALLILLVLLLLDLWGFGDNCLDRIHYLLFVTFAFIRFWEGWA